MMKTITVALILLGATDTFYEPPEEGFFTHRITVGEIAEFDCRNKPVVTAQGNYFHASWQTPEGGSCESWTHDTIIIEQILQTPKETEQ